MEIDRKKLGQIHRALDAKFRAGQGRLAKAIAHRNSILAEQERLRASHWALQDDAADFRQAGLWGSFREQKLIELSEQISYLEMAEAEMRRSLRKSFGKAEAARRLRDGD